MSISEVLGRIRPRRRIDGISAVFLPFDTEGKPDLDAFAFHLRRTHEAGLTCAVNMDTGFGPQLSPPQRAEILRLTRHTLGDGVRFVAGAMPFGEDGDLLDGYAASMRAILAVDAVPIVFPSDLLASGDVVEHHRRIIEPAREALAFELGAMFASFGRIHDTDTFRRLLEIPNLVGLKHSSLDRRLEWERLAIRDAERPEFGIYTGNDLAIDMVAYGSDYLLGLSTFDPEAFALRDRLWAAEDERFFAVNDALQAVGAAAFREPVPAYKHSAAVYLRITGRLRDPYPHPGCPRRPDGEDDLLRPLAQRVAEAVR